MRKIQVSILHRMLAPSPLAEKYPHRCTYKVSILHRMLAPSPPRWQEHRKKPIPLFQSYTGCLLPHHDGWADRSDGL